MKKWYYLEQKDSDKKVGVCMDGGHIIYITRYDEEQGRRVYGEVLAWSDEERLYAPWYYVARSQPTLAELRAGLRSGSFIAG